MTPPVPDGPDTELAAIVADLDDLHTEAASVAMRSEGSVTAAAEEVRDDVASIRDRLRAVLARPDGTPQHLVRGDRVETVDGVRATVTGPAPRGPYGEPAVNLDWDGDAGGPAYEHDLRRVVDARPAAGRDLVDVEDGPTAVELLDDNERLGAALVDIGIAVGLPRPSATVRWGAPEILARIATINSELKVPPRAAARIAQARADQAEGYGSTTSTVEGLLRELDRRGSELVRLRAALARPAVARTDGQPPADPEDSPWAALVRELKAHADQVAAGDLSGLPTTEYQCGLVDGYRGAAGRVRQVLIQQSAPAAPTDAAAVSDGRVWSDGNCGWGWVCERCGYRSVAWWPDRDVAERAAAEHERDRCPATGRPVRDSQGCES